MNNEKILDKDTEFGRIEEIYDECINYLKAIRSNKTKTNLFLSNKQTSNEDISPDYIELNSNGYETIHEVNRRDFIHERSESFIYEESKFDYKVENETHRLKSDEHKAKAEGNKPEVITSVKKIQTDLKSERLRRFSQQLPRIIITQSNSSLDGTCVDNACHVEKTIPMSNGTRKSVATYKASRAKRARDRVAYGELPRRLVSKNGIENVALISNVPYERIRLLNDTFHTLINLRWRWIVSGTIVVHFLIWLVFAVFWYITALAHYDFEPDPPKRACVTGGKDFATIFLASVEAQTTIGFGDRTIDEECPESIFLFIMQLILGTGLSGVLTCVVYAKLTRPEKLSRDGVGFSKKAVISMRDGAMCLMMRAWDLNYDHIISSEFNAHFVKTHRTKEGEVIRYFARSLDLQQRQFLLWPLTLVHVIDESSPLYNMSPDDFANFSYEITVSLKGASASMGTFTQSQTSYLPREILWGYRFPPVVRYDTRKQKYVIEHKKLDLIEPLDTPYCSAAELERSCFDQKRSSTPLVCPGSPSSFSDQISGFHLERSSSFRSGRNEIKLD